jgi:CRISPR type III-A-associated protein Csm2
MMSQRPPQAAHRAQDRPGPASARLTAQQVRSLFDDTGYLAVNEHGKQLADALVAAGVTRSQVRNILNSFQAISESWEAGTPQEHGRQIARLKPNLVYLAARETNQQRKGRLAEFAETLGLCVDAVLDGGIAGQEMKRRFTTLVDLVEAVTAYHRARARD